MAVTVAELQVQFNAETKRFKAQVDTIDKRLGRFESSAKKKAGGVAGAFKKLRSVIKGVGPAIAGVAAAVGAGFLIAGVKNALAFGDSIAQVSKKIGFGAEALQELRFAAEQNGIAQNTLDLALQRFSRRVAEAAVGTGEAKKALEEMNIELKDAEGNFVGNEKVLSQVADAFAKTSSSSDRLRLAFKLFDSEGAGLVNLLSQGAAGLQLFRDQARNLGLVLDADVIANAERMNSEFSIATQVISTTLTQAFLDFAPVVTQLATDFSELVREISDVLAGFKDVENLTLRQLTNRIKDTKKEVAFLEEKLGEITTPGATQKFFRIDKGDLVRGEAALATAKLLVDARKRLFDQEQELADKRFTPDEPTGGGGGLTPLETPEAAAARKKLEAEQRTNINAIRALNNSLRQDRLAATEPLLADIDALEVEIAKTSLLRVANAELNEEKTQALVGLATERARVAELLKTETEAQLTLERELEEAVTAVAVADFDRAEAILVALAARKAEAVGVEETNDAVVNAIAAIKRIKPSDTDEDADVFNIGESVSGAVNRGVLEGLSAAFTGEGVDIAETFSQIFGDIFLESMNELLSDLTDSLADVINEFAAGIGDAAGGEGGFADKFNVGAALGAAFSIGGQLLAGALKDTQVDIKRANITSAVNSSQQIRGVVAGPTGIAVAQVSDKLQDVMIPTEMLLAEIRDSNNRIAASVAAAGGGGGITPTGGFDPTSSQSLGG